MASEQQVVCENEKALKLLDDEKCTTVIIVTPQESAPQEEKDVDPYALTEHLTPTGKLFSEMSGKEKLQRVAINCMKILLLVGLLYMFICSLSFLSSAFRLLGGKAAGEAFSSNAILNNPVAGLMIGVLATVLVQSSSTSTSIVVTMVASKIIHVRPAIPIIMGANIGTSVTNTLVSLAQANDRSQFRRAFAGATVHDMFNILSVLVFLPLEVATGYLYKLTSILVRDLHQKGGAQKLELLKKITKPFTSLVIRLDTKVIERIAQGDKSAMQQSLVKYWCDKGKKVITTRLVNNTNNATTAQQGWLNETVTVHSQPCSFLLHDTGFGDSAVGAIMLVGSLVILCCCLVFIVKLLHSMLRGQIAVVIRKTINSDFPYPFGWLTGYFAILVGAGMTILVQSSSIFTSALTPLVGLGIVSLERIYPLTLGANIGTTGTGILAALASSGDRLGYALQIALCHLFFNISGILLWYPPKFMRRVPINMAKGLGNITADYRWFAPVYVILFFFVVPATAFGLSLAGWYYLLAVALAIVLPVLFVVIVNFIRPRRPSILPRLLHSWDWAPLWTRSLEPYDKVVIKLCKYTGKLNVRTILKRTRAQSHISSHTYDLRSQGNDGEEDLKINSVV